MQTTKSLPKPVYFSKINIDKKGMMQILFNQNLSVPDFAQTILKLNQNYSSHKIKSSTNLSLELYSNNYLK